MTGMALSSPIKTRKADLQPQPSTHSVRFPAAFVGFVPLRSACLPSAVGQGSGTRYPPKTYPILEPSNASNCARTTP